MVARLGFWIAALLASGLSYAVIPLIEESVGEQDRDEAVLEDFAAAIDLASASEAELSAIPVWSSTTVKQWIALREKYPDIEWTWAMLADSLGLERFQVEQLREFTSFKTGAQEKIVARMTAAGAEADDLSGWSVKLRARQELRGWSRTEILAVRRADDSRMIDDLHVGVSGRVKGTKLKYAAGTYQLDWGLGLLSSKGFGTARAFTSMESLRPEFGAGISATIPSSEYSWRRGLAVEYASRVQMFAGANAREWNARVEDDVASLTGSLQTDAGALDYRDRLREQSGFAGARVERAGIEAGALIEASGYDPGLLRGKTVREGSLFFGLEKWGVTARSEGARAEGSTAVCGALSRGTERLAWTLYSVYSEEGYAPLRGQGWRGYGEVPNHESRRGMRAAWWGSAHRVFAEVRDESESDRSRGEAEARWYYDWNRYGQFHVRALAGVLEGGAGDALRSYERVRVESKWDRDFRFSARAEIRQSRDLGGGDPQHGSYMFLQAEGDSRFVRPGLRVTRFDLPSSEGPALVYENDLTGAYPIQYLSGSGMRVAGWVSLQRGFFRAAVKAAMLRRDAADEEFEFGVEATFAR